MPQFSRVILECCYWYCTADAQYDVKNNQPSETPTANHAITRFKLTIVTIVSSSERLAMANLSWPCRDTKLLCDLASVLVYSTYMAVDNNQKYTTVCITASGFLPDIILSTPCYYYQYHSLGTVTRLNPMTSFRPSGQST